jgi:hypothetical protein
VVQTEFHGHDTVITVRPLDTASGLCVPGDLLQARLADGAPPPMGSEVTLTARGAVMAWPA